ncbi:DUF1837 domain-containing protein [Micromonospora sp. STR1s_5]|nr:DUF1837 domain-containing protein [Micromonospora sp. STR1s_5]
MSVYDLKPERFFERLAYDNQSNPSKSVCCAGFELQTWRAKPFANHLIEWLPEYALLEEELTVNHGNMYVRLQQAAVRVYTSDKYKGRGEAGEIAVHAICRDYFDTIPISPRVFYKSSSNDVVKSFDMLHARIPENGEIELWLGESKIYKSANAAITDAITSVKLHLDQGFLTNQKLILGPQIPKTIPRYEEIVHLFKSQTTLDKLLASSVFVVGILCNSGAAKAATQCDDVYRAAAMTEMQALADKLSTSGLPSSLRFLLLYIPLGDKDELVNAFDNKLKGLQ